MCKSVLERPLWINLILAKSLKWDYHFCVSFSLKQFGTIVLALVILLLGLLFGLSGFSGLSQWSALARPLAVCLLLIEICALTMMVCGVWMLSRLGRDLRPLRLGGIAAASCGIVIIAGVLVHAIPCSSPT